MSQKQPNILFLFSDQHSARTLGCYGNPEVRTPHLDALAASGVLMSRAYCNNPICTPSRMCFLSGQYAHNHRHYGLMGPAPERLPSLFTHARRHGYRTGMAGKIHTPAGWLARDCDEVSDAYGHETPVTAANGHQIVGAQGMERDAFTDELERRGLAALRDDKFLQETLERDPAARGVQAVDARQSRLHAADTVEAWSADRAVNFIQGAERDGQPWCYWLTLPRPHQVYAPSPEFWNLYDGDSLTFPPNADDDLAGRHPAARQTQRRVQQQTGWMHFEPKTWEAARRRVLRGYYGCVSQVDDAVGRVLAELDRLGIRENTIVVYSTDHGEFAGEHGMIEKAPGIGFHCVTRVPMIWSWPGKLPAGEARDGLFESVDLLPTIAALAGWSPPDWVDGVEQRGLLEGGGEGKACAVTENPLARTIHTRRYKLTYYPPELQGGAEFGELFDLERDPWERTNLYFDPAHREVVVQLRQQLYDWLARTIRTETEHPSAPVIPGSGGSGNWTNWDLAGDLRAADGALKPHVRPELIRRGSVNYL